MKKGTKSRLLALLCAFVLCFCDTGIVLAENNVTLPAAGENQDGAVLPDDGTIETPDEDQAETPDEPEQTPEETPDETPERQLESPVLTVENTWQNVSLSWNAIEGATRYLIMRDDLSDSSEGLIDYKSVEADKTTYLDTSVRRGRYYEYKVIAKGDGVQDGESEIVKIMHLQEPTLQAEPGAEGMFIYWEASGSSCYYILEKYNEETGWEILTKTEELTYVDSEVSGGVVYKYRVQGIYEEEEATYRSCYSEFAAGFDRLAAPVKFKATNNGYTQIKLSWEEVIGATGYQVYRSAKEDGTYKLVAETNELKYVDKKLTTDKTYYYKVRAYAKGIKSGFSQIKSATPRVLTPKMNKTANATGTSIKVSWSKPAGAHGYYVYRKQGASGTWKQVATIKNADTTSYKDTTATGKYYYAVKAYKKVNGKTYISLRANSIQASVLKKASIKVKQNGTKRATVVTWEKISNATGYQVYKKIGKNGSWELAGKTDSDARSFSSEIPQGTYTYWKVRAIRKIGEVTTCALFSDSKSFIFANPKFNFDISGNYGEVTQIRLTIENTSKASLRFYSDNAALFSEEDEVYDRDMYLVNAAGKRLNYSDVKAGNVKTFTYEMDGRATRYNRDSIVCVVFRYDGLKYVLLSYANGSYFELYLEEDMYTDVEAN